MFDQAYISSRLKDFKLWRQNLHQYPELAFHESLTSEFVINKLDSFGVAVVSGLGKTGGVGILKAGSSNKSIGLRADMDALPMQELNDFDHQSKHDGIMHACGHDGHTVMLLAAAEYLSRTKNFDGTVHFIFQPAEEANEQGSGAKAMIDEGLFVRFPMDCVFAMHNAPGLKAGAIATRPGAIMSSMDLFDVTITGQGTHGAYPHTGVDPIVVASSMINAWQSIVSRSVSSQESAVISVTSLSAGDSYNVIPHQAMIKGSIRTLSVPVQEQVKQRFYQIAQSVAEAFGASVTINYQHAYPVTVNDKSCTDFACGVAESIVGTDQLITDAPPVMGSEDFAYMLKEKPGCYLWLGNSDPQQHKQSESDIAPFGHLAVQDPCMVHDPHYDFNDDIIPVGASLFVGLVEQYLSKDSKLSL